MRRSSTATSPPASPLSRNAAASVAPAAWRVGEVPGARLDLHQGDVGLMYAEWVGKHPSNVRGRAHTHGRRREASVNTTRKRFVKRSSALL
jgi:hypothetical protein